MARILFGTRRRAHLLRRAPLFLVAAIFCLTSAPVTRAQEGNSGSGRLESISVSGSIRYTSDQILPATGLHAGQQVTRDDIQKGADGLAAYGPFTNIKYRFFTGATGVEIQYEVADAPAVPVLFDNFPWFTDEQLNAAIKSSVPLFDGTTPDHGTILDQISSAIAHQLQAQGITANISHELITPPWNEQRVMRFAAEEGAPPVSSVEFTDALAKTDRAIADRLGDLIGKPFSRMAFKTFEFEQVRPIYFAHAFLRVSFGEPAARIESNKVAIRAPIDPGPAFVWNGVTWTGNQAIASSELTKLVQVNLGGPAEGMKIQATWESVRAEYQKIGYLDVALDPVAHLDESTKLASYEVKISEGPQYHMGNLVLTGLSLEGEKRVRSAWKIQPGAVFDDSLYQQFLNTGIRQAFVGLPFHYEKVGRFLDKNAADGKINVMLDFQ